MSTIGEIMEAIDKIKMEEWHLQNLTQKLYQAQRILNNEWEIEGLERQIESQEKLIGILRSESL